MAAAANGSFSTSNGTENPTNNTDKATCVASKVPIEHEVHLFQKTFTKEQMLSLCSQELAVDIRFDVTFNSNLFSGTKNKFTFHYSAAANSTSINLKLEGIYSDKIDLVDIRYAWVTPEIDSEASLKTTSERSQIDMEKKLIQKEYIKVKHQLMILRESFKPFSVLRAYFVVYPYDKNFQQYLNGLFKTNFNFSRSYFQLRKFSDVHIAVDDEIFPAHRLILSERSPVFERMFESDMTEDSTKTVWIEDFSSSIVKEFLQFLYTGFCSSLDSNNKNGKNVDNVISLFQLSDKYDVSILKNICEFKLKNMISVGNIMRIHTIAYLHNAERLGVETGKFFQKHRKEIIPTTEALMDLMKESNPNTIHDLLINKM